MCNRNQQVPLRHEGGKLGLVWSYFRIRTVSENPLFKMGLGGSKEKQTTELTPEEQAYADACKKCKQVPYATYHRIFAAAIAVLSIVIIILVWFTGLLFQIINVILAFLVFALGLMIAILPIECGPCKCS